MSEIDMINVISAGMKAIAANDMSALSGTFSPDCSFFVGQNPYRIETLKNFKEAGEAFFQAGGKIVHFDIRQPKVVESGSAALVSFHYAQRLELNGVSTGTNGRGSAVLFGDAGGHRIMHLHLTENSGVASSLPAGRAAPAAEVLSAVSRIEPASLRGLMWGTE